MSASSPSPAPASSSSSSSSPDAAPPALPAAELSRGLALRWQLQLAMAECERGMQGRSREVRALTLGALADCNVLLLGPPGVAKTMIAQRVGDQFQAVTRKPTSAADTHPHRFQVLLTAFTRPDELFGAYKLKEMAEGNLVRKTDGKLPKREWVLLDEIFNASSEVLNTLLTVLNEKKVYDGQEWQDTEHVAMVGLSNQPPHNNDTGMQALYDRFLIRMWVNYVGFDTEFDQLLETRKQAPPRVGAERLHSVRIDRTFQREITDGAKSVLLPDDIRERIKIFRRHTLLNSHHDVAESGKFLFSDRRWLQFVQLMRISAYTDGRTQIELPDLMMLKHSAWRVQDERQEVEDAFQQFCIDSPERPKLSDQEKRRVTGITREHIWLADEDKALLIKWLWGGADKVPKESSGDAAAAIKWVKRCFGLACPAAFVPQPGSADEGRLCHGCHSRMHFTDSPVGHTANIGPLKFEFKVPLPGAAPPMPYHDILLVSHTGRGPSSCPPAICAAGPSGRKVLHADGVALIDECVTEPATPEVPPQRWRMELLPVAKNVLLWYGSQLIVPQLRTAVDGEPELCHEFLAIDQSRVLAEYLRANPEYSFFEGAWLLIWCCPDGAWNKKFAFARPQGWDGRNKVPGLKLEKKVRCWHLSATRSRLMPWTKGDEQFTFQ